jgi:hypothetical protein
MARLFEIGQRILCWNCNECEERALIAAYCDIKSRVPASPQRWIDEFEQEYFTVGSALMASTLAHINMHRKRLDRSEFILQESNADALARNGIRAERASIRRQILNEYEPLGKIDREKWWMSAMAEIARQAPPHRTWEEYKQNKAEVERDEEINLSERTRRAAAIAVHRERPVLTVKSVPYRNKSERLLAAAATLPPEMAMAAQTKIVTKITSDEALDLLEAIDDPALKLILIERVLAD